MNRINSAITKPKLQVKWNMKKIKGKILENEIKKKEDCKTSNNSEERQQMPCLNTTNLYHKQKKNSFDRIKNKLVTSP